MLVYHHMDYNVITKANTGMHCFYIKASSLKSLASEKRIICQVGDISFHCALMKHKSGDFYVYIGKDTLKKLGLREGMTVKPRFSKDESDYQFEFPKEFKEVLKTDPEANRAFEKLTDGKKRGLMYLITKLKSTDKRIEKSLLIAENLKNGITSPQAIMKR